MRQWKNEKFFDKRQEGTKLCIRYTTRITCVP